MRTIFNFVLWLTFEEIVTISREKCQNWFRANSKSLGKFRESSSGSTPRSRQSFWAWEVNIRLSTFTKFYRTIVKGFCMNTTDGTVKGKLEGDEGRMRQMMEWLKTTGSPKSNITKALFSDPKPIKEFSVRSFSIKR